MDLEKRMKLNVSPDSVSIYIENEDKDPTHICCWHIDEWDEDPEVFVSIINAVSLFHTNKKKLLKILKIDLDELEISL